MLLLTMKVIKTNDNELEWFIAETIKDINDVARWDSLGDELFSRIITEIERRVKEQIERFKEKEKWGIVWKEKALEKAIINIVGREIIEKLEQKIY